MTNSIETDATKMLREPWTFYWLTGRREVLRGDTAEDALNRAGYSVGALRALDFFAAGDQRDVWAWDAENAEWVKAGESTMNGFGQ